MPEEFWQYASQILFLFSPFRTSILEKFVAICVPIVSCVVFVSLFVNKVCYENSYFKLYSFVNICLLSFPISIKTEDRKSVV